jgi:phosphatidylglycerophosphate synthase
MANDQSAPQTGDRRPIAARSLAPSVWLADRLVRARVSPDAISLAGLAAGCLAGLCFGLVGAVAHAWPLWLLGAVLVLLRLLANMMDGMVAVGRGIASPTGELYNEVPDRISDSVVLIGVGVGAAWPQGPALGFAAALAAMGTAYVRAVGKGAGAPSDFSGPMAKQQRMMLVVALALWCAAAPAAWGTLSALPCIVLAVVIAGSLVTAARRLVHIAAALGRRA